MKKTQAETATELIIQLNDNKKKLEILETHKLEFVLVTTKIIRGEKYQHDQAVRGNFYPTEAEVKDLRSSLIDSYYSKINKLNQQLKKL